MQTELKSWARFPELLYRPLSETLKTLQSKFSTTKSLAKTMLTAPQKILANCVKNPLGILNYY